jgi:mono/diheme cytochrome c family protein
MKRVASTLVALAVVAVAGPALAGSKGKDLFDETCAACHGEKGTGIPGLAPPLKGSQFVNSTDAAALATFIQKGRSGSEKHFPNLPSPMPPYGGGQSKSEAIVQYVKGDLQK